LHFWGSGITDAAGVVFDNGGFNAGCDHFSSCVGNSLHGVTPRLMNLRRVLELLSTCALQCAKPDDYSRVVKGQPNREFQAELAHCPCHLKNRLK
jgi:hypothetical protein